MFRKKIDAKGCTLLKTSEKKKFRSLVSSEFFQRRAVAKPEAETLRDDEDGMPSDLRSSLVKGDVALTKATTDNGNKQFEFYSLDKTPIVFSSDDNIHPTVYLLWSIPSMLPRIYTHAEVFEKLKTGADLMLPGVIRPDALNQAAYQFPIGARCAVCVIGNDAAVAVGEALMSGADMLTSEVRKGKAVRLLHTYQDCLWEQGPKTRIPSITVSPSGDTNGEKDDITAAAPLDKLELTNVLEEMEAASLSRASADGATPPDTSMDNDTRFLLYFLYALEKRLRRNVELPILASTFYGSMLLPLMPPDEEKKIPIQRTSYKKFNVFLRQMQEDGLVVIEEPKKGVETIAHVVWDHEFFGRYARELKSLPTADKTEAAPIASKVDETPMNIRELRAITAPVLPLFGAVNKSFKKGQALGAADVRSAITSYVKSKQLANGRMVKLDDLLATCCVHCSADKHAAGESISWEALMDAIFGKMAPCVEIEYADKAKALHKGKPPTIRIRVAKRAGNKKVTMIDNVEAFGIDPKTLAHELQVALAVSATLNESPGNVGPQVQVQGDKANVLNKMFIEKYNISKKYVQVA